MARYTSNTAPCAVALPGAPYVAGETKPVVNSRNSCGRLTVHTPGLNSLYDTFLRGRALAGRNAAAFGYRPLASGAGEAEPYQWVTWDGFHERFVHVSSGFRHLGLIPNDNIGILLNNSIEWVLTEYAGYYQRFVSVPLYDTLSRDVLMGVIRETDMRLVVCGSNHALMLVAMAQSIPSVQTLVVVGPVQPDLVHLAAANGLRVETFAAVEEAGSRQPLDPVKLPTADDIASIVYTSGTSGRPRGVVLRHSNFLATITALLAMRDAGDMYNFSTGDCSIGFLPLAHCLGRMVMHLLIVCGGRTAFPRGDPAKLIEDLHDLQPTIFVGVPRIFNRIQDRVLSTVRVKGGLPAALFQYAYSTKKSNLTRGMVGHWLWDRVVFKPLREKFGGRLGLIVSGSAPISPETLEFLRCCFSCVVVEGYGLTETVGPTAVTLADDIEPGNVGAPISSSMMKLRSVPEMGYTVDDVPMPRGEILIKGANISCEYYRQPEATRETFTSDGWLCTGDIGAIDARGRFHIIDRRNNLFKMAQGEFIAPERIENVLMDHFVVDQAFVHGDAMQSSLVAIIVPEKTLLPMFLMSKGVVSEHVAQSASIDDLCQNPRAREAVLAELALWAKAHDLRGFETPKRILLFATPFDKLDLLTPTMKLKRRAAQAYFSEMLVQMYADGH